MRQQNNKYVPNFKQQSHRPQYTVHDKLNQWLLPLGYKEVFCSNFMSIDMEIHYMKDHVRVVCFPYKDSMILSADVLNKEIPITLKTGKFNLFDSRINALHNTVKQTLDQLQSDILTLTKPESNQIP